MIPVHYLEGSAVALHTSGHGGLAPTYEMDAVSHFGMSKQEGECTMSEKLQMAMLSYGQLNRNERQEFLSAVSPKVGQMAPAPGPAKILRFRTAADRLGFKSTKSIMRLCESAGIRKLTLPGHRRASGILESDLARLLVEN